MLAAHRANADVAASLMQGVPITRQEGSGVDSVSKEIGEHHGSNPNFHSKIAEKRKGGVAGKEGEKGGVEVRSAAKMVRGGGWVANQTHSG